ncbi:MAG: 7-carboxy-7-deazaguanine synthase QueE [Myxococcota bacterium]|jgi:7-carboxy-7-deazaguanine synthase|nr:7-carboxy-7-deazaguanine synthase QueE [Myxococcota bacterium]
MAEDVEFNLVEMFWSAQGEGPHVGCATVFLRFGGCDLRCAWCDSPGTWLPAKTFRWEVAPGSGEFRSQSNPISAGQIGEALTALGPMPGTFLSLTGGEPLLQPEAVRVAARLGRERGLRVALETHGLAHDAMEHVAGSVDYVSMDWKLESDVTASKEAAGDERYAGGFGRLHEEFLGLLAARGLEASVKVVITKNTLDSELERVCAALTAIAPSTPLILQPVTPMGKVKEQPSAETLLGQLRFCQERVREVRLIPQTHRVYGAL